MSKIVRRALGEYKLTPKDKRELAKLAARPDSEIDFSDIPESPTGFWKDAVRNPFYRPIKKQITLRLDADVIEWLRRQGKGYQTRANALLRDVMIKDLSKKAG